jgi:hypothetical protein
MGLVEDLTVFFNDAEFANVALLGGVEVRGVFDRPYTEAQMGAYTAVATGRATFTLPTAQAAGALGKALVIDGIGSFIVAEVQPDGTGVTALILEVA